MEELRIYTAINSRYQAFDASGGLPFSVVFGLCRRSVSTDPDPRPLTLNTAKSVFDVPYALANGLLTLHERSKEGDSDSEVDLSHLRFDDSEPGSYVTLSSPVERSGNWKNAFESFLCHIDAKSDLATHLQSGRSYAIRMKSQDLGVKWWSYGNREELMNVANRPLRESEPAKLISQKAVGGANFAVASSLPWPPRTETHLRQRQDLGSGEDREVVLEVTVLNTTDQAVTVQTGGHQNFLFPWGSLQPDEDAFDLRPRIIDTAGERAPLSSLQITDIATGTVVREIPKPASAPLTTKHDPRPALETLTTLEPGVPLVRSVDISNLLKGLPEGKYGVRLAPRGMWWCPGSLANIIETGGNRVLKELYKTTIPPLWLESDDVVEVQVGSGAR